MPDAWDDEVLKRSDDLRDPKPSGRPAGLWVVVAVLMAAAAIAAYVVFSGRPASEGTTTTVEVPEPVAAEVPVQPLGSDTAPIDLPPLDESDVIVREMVRALSGHPQVAAWLATDGLIRNFTVVVANIAEGKTPAPVLRALRPSAGFRVTELGDNLYIDPRSYERYTGFAEGVASIDPAGSTRLYALLKPRIEEAYAELGYPDRPFDRTLERAIVALLEPPVPDGLIRVEPRGIGYGFDDRRLQALTAAQKQLLRMGPENARTVQRKLHEIALALNIPAERLPVSE